MTYSETGSVARNTRVFFLGNLFVSIGILVVTTGGSWDISNHLLNKPETFFSPPHFVLYSGVMIALFGASLVMLKISDEKIKSTNLASIRLVQVGIVLLVGAGPFDFLWHSNFGLDGLLSPPHLALIFGMVICSIGSFASIVKSAAFASCSYVRQNTLVVIGIIPIWLSVTGLLFSFSLPFSKTDYFDFNPNPVFGSIFATAAFPFLISTMLFLAYHAGGKRFGFVSTTGAALIIINMTTSIIPNHWLHPTVMFYLFTMVPIILCDVTLKLSSNRLRAYFAAGVFGILSYFVYYPLITHVYNKIDTNQIVSASITAKIYFEMIPSVFPLIAIPCAVMGVVGLVACKRIAGSFSKTSTNSQLL